MYLSFKELMLAILKGIIIISIVAVLVALGILDYHIGIGYCNLLNIPKDLALTMVSPGMAIEVGIVLFFFEFIALCFSVKVLKRFKTFDKFCNFLNLDY